jgi:hypothetical protein
MQRKHDFIKRKMKELRADIKRFIRGFIGSSYKILSKEVQGGN